MNDLSAELEEKLGVGRIVVLECTLFDERHSSCPGSGPVFMYRVARNDKFEGWLKAAKSAIFSELRRKRVRNPMGEVNLYIVTVCRTGKHKSVACAELLAVALEELRWKVKVNHMCDQLWGRCMGNCQRCQQYAHVNNDTFELALTIWQLV